MTTKILCVLGRGRSGSTIFGNVIGAHEGFFAAGELRYFWDPVVTRDAPCACGLAISSCPVWSQVLAKLADIAPEDAGRLQREVVTERNLPRLLRSASSRGWRALDEFIEVMSRTYRAIAEVTGEGVIVDTSKRPSYAAFLRLLEGADLYCIHLTRDPRASAYSWAHTQHASVFGEATTVPQRGAIDSTLRWNVLNIECEILARKLPPSSWMRLRYEDFVAAPRQMSSQVATFVGEPAVASPFKTEDTLVIGPNHTVAGNPARLVGGEISVRDRREWQSRQPGKEKLLATLVALPLLRRYGYPVRAGSS